MRLALRTMGGGRLALGAMGLVVGLAGCGGSNVASSTSTRKSVTLPAIQLASPVLPKTNVLPAKYACNPKIGVPPLKWGALPAKTAGIALVVFFVQRGQLEAQAALTGLKATLHELKAGAVPHGAVIASNSKVICPTKGVNATYFIRVYALKSPAKLPQGANVGAAVNAIAASAVGAGSIEVHYRRA